MTNVYFVRHGETDLNHLHVAQGHIDTHGLNEVGRKQAELLRAFVAGSDLKCDVILCSPLRRAIETAQPLSALFGKPLRIDARLQEIFFGDCEGMSTESIRQRVFDPPLEFHDSSGAYFYAVNGKQLREWHNSTDPRYDHVFHPSGETKTQARDRVAEAVFDHLEEAPATKDLWIVTHGAVTRFLMARFASPALAAAGVKNASVLHFTYDPDTPRYLEWQGILHAPDGAEALI